MLTVSFLNDDYDEGDNDDDDDYYEDEDDYE